MALARSNGATVLREAAAAYTVDTNAVALKVKQEFEAKEKAKKDNKQASSRSTKRKAA